MIPSTKGLKFQNNTASFISLLKICGILFTGDYFLGGSDNVLGVFFVRRDQSVTEENNPLSDIFVETPLTANLGEESGTINPNFLSSGTHNLKMLQLLSK